MAEQSKLPSWYRLWRGAAIAGFLAFVGGVLVAIPEAMLSATPNAFGSETTQNVALLYHNLVASSLGLMLILFGIGFVMGILVLIAAVLRFLSFYIRRTVVRDPRIETAIPSLLVVVGGVASFVALALIGPAIGSLFSSNSYGTCLIHIKVVVFEDNNNNGIRDVSERSIPKANVSVLSNNKVIQSGVTDDVGYAQFSGVEQSCVAGSLDSSDGSTRMFIPDSVTLSVQSSEVNPGHTFLSGPFSIRWSLNWNVAYVPIRQGN